MEAAPLPHAGHGAGGAGGLVPTAPWDGITSLVALLADAQPLHSGPSFPPKN